MSTRISTSLSSDTIGASIGTSRYPSNSSGDGARRARAWFRTRRARQSPQRRADSPAPAAAPKDCNRQAGRTLIAVPDVAHSAYHGKRQKDNSLPWSIAAGSGTRVWIVGHGLTVNDGFPLGPGVTISPEPPGINDSFASRNLGELRTKVSVLAMQRVANFSLVVEEPSGGKALAV